MSAGSSLVLTPLKWYAGGVLLLTAVGGAALGASFGHFGAATGGTTVGTVVGNTGTFSSSLQTSLDAARAGNATTPAPAPHP